MSSLSSSSGSKPFKTGVKTLAFGVLIVVVVTLLIMGTCSGDDKDKDKNSESSDQAQSAPPVQVIEVPTPLVTTAITPTKLEVDYEFNIEAEGPVRITYPDGQSMVFYPGKGCQQFPTPRYSGPKNFTDPDSPDGHTTFRLYRLRPGEGTC